MGRQSRKATERLQRLVSMSREDAMKAMMDEKTNVPKRWCDTCQHETTYSGSGLGMFICNLCNRDNTPIKVMERNGACVREEKS